MSRQRLAALYRNFPKVPNFREVLAPESVSTQSEPPLAEQISHLDIYPNPAHRSIIIKAPSQETTLHIAISNLLGQEISRQSIPNGGSMDITTLANGVYLVVAITPSGKAYSGTVRKSE